MFIKVIRWHLIHIIFIIKNFNGNFEFSYNLQLINIKFQHMKLVWTLLFQYAYILLYNNKLTTLKYINNNFIWSISKYQMCLVWQIKLTYPYKLKKFFHPIVWTFQTKHQNSRSISFQLFEHLKQYKQSTYSIQFIPKIKNLTKISNHFLKKIVYQIHKLLPK